MFVVFSDMEKASNRVDRDQLFVPCIHFCLICIYVSLEC